MSLFFYFCIMGIVLLSTAYLPPLSWIKAALDADEIRIEKWETYPRQTFRNRCRIAAANDVLALSIPVKKIKGKNSMTKDIEICYAEDWQRLHRRSIEDAYTNSPFYLYYWDDFRRHFDKKYRFLLDLNTELLDTTFSILGKTTDIRFTEEFVKSPPEVKDLREFFGPKLAVDPTNFKRYPQVFEEKHGFLADLSIIDLIFNEGPAAAEYFVNSK